MQRVTERGQITLPAAWRRNHAARTIVVRERGDLLEIAPLRTEDERDDAWVTIFDAFRDNGGRGIPADDMISALEGSLAKKRTSHGRAR